MIDQTSMEFFGDDPEPCLAGTICLMSLYRDNPCPIIANKIIHNLHVLAQQPAFSISFRTLLGELHQDWSKRLASELADRQRPRDPSKLH